MWLVQALIPYGLNIMKKEEGESSLILVVGKFVIMPPRGHIAKIFFCVIITNVERGRGAWGNRIMSVQYLSWKVNTTCTVIS